MTTRAEALRAVRGLPRRAVMSAVVARRVGDEVLRQIRIAYVVKALGGEDLAGERWLPTARKKRRILRETDTLFRSLSPGSGSPYQVFYFGVGEVTVGTSVPYAAHHHHGTRSMPQRRLWPEPSKWPPAWWSAVAEQARRGVLEELKGSL